MSDLAAKLVTIASNELGVREVTANFGPRIVEYQRATWLDPGLWPWCAAFTAWCLKQWLALPGMAAVLKVPEPESWRCRDPRAYGWEAWARQRGLWVFDESRILQPGDIVTYDFSHIGIVVSDRGANIETIEGNTNDKGSREGDGVYRKFRQRNLVRTAIRLTKEETPRPYPGSK